MLVSIENVKITPGYEPTDREVRRIEPIIKRQGLIEPLKLDGNDEIGRKDCWDPARLYACRILGFKDVIVAYDNGKDY